MMPSTLRPGDADTPPSTRPSSSASTASSSGLHPLRTTSMDSLPSAPVTEKVEHIPTRTVGAAPKANAKAMMFVKTGPASLYKSAAEQMKQAQTVKEMRRQAVREEEEPDWQQSAAAAAAPDDDQDDWRANLDKWKMNRRKRNEDVLERVIEVKKFESEQSQTRRKSKTFSEMREETGKRGLRRNLVVHDDDDNNDLTGLGLSGDPATGPKVAAPSYSKLETNSNKISATNELNNTSNSTNVLKNSTNELKNSGTFNVTTSGHRNTSSSTTTSTSSVIKESVPAKDILLDHDNKDAKSDAGFCTGSDTGSDGQFHEDNMSDTSSALGDKKEAHDSLLDAGMPLKEEDASVHDSVSSSSKQETIEYTYDKAIEGYKQYAQTSAKKRTASLSNLASIDKTTQDPVTPTGNITNKLDFFVKEMDKEYVKPSPKPTVRMRDQSTKVDITKRRTMFEMSQSTSTINMSSSGDASRLDRRRSSEMTASAGNLRNKVASFETLDSTEEKSKTAISAPKDTKFKEKLANFSSMSSEGYTPTKKKTPEKDKNFFQKLASFSNLEHSEESHQAESKTAPFPQVTTKTLKSKIASFEQLDQQEYTSDFRLEGRQDREQSASMENLAKAPTKKLESRLRKSSTDVLAEETAEETSSTTTTNRTSLSSSSTVRETSTSFLQKSNSSVRGENSSRKDVSDSRNLLNSTGEEASSMINSVASSSYDVSSSRDTSTFSRSDVTSSRNEIISSRKDISSRSEMTSLRSETSSSRDDIFSARQETSSIREETYGAKNDGPSTNEGDGTTPVKKGDGKAQASVCPPLDLKGGISTCEAPISTSSPRSVAEKDAYAAAKSADDDERTYDDVLNVAQSSNAASETNAQAYTDDDINEAINYSSPHVSAMGGSSVGPAGTSVGPAATSVGPAGTSKVATSPTRRQLPTVPPTPYKPPTSAVASVKAPSPVVFVDWSSGGGPIAPPSEPPPPPPPEEGESDEDAAAPSEKWDRTDASLDQSAGSPTPSETPSQVHSEASSRTSTSTREELRRRRSNFLGTSSDLAAPTTTTESLLQRQQQETDRKLLEARRSLQQSTAQVLSDIDQSRSARHQSLQSSKSYESSSRNRYTWEDRIRADTSSQPDNLNDTDDGYNYHNKLEELEAEMLRHDRTVISRTLSQQQQQQQHHQQQQQQHQQQLHQQHYAGNATYEDVVPPSVDMRADVGNNYTNSSSTNEHSSSVNYSSEAYRQDTSSAGYQQDNCRYQQELESKDLDSRSVLRDVSSFGQDARNYDPHPAENYHDSRSHGSHPSNAYRDRSDGGSHQLDSVSSFSAPEKPVRTYNTCYDSSAPQQQVPPEPLPRKLLPQVPKENRPELPAQSGAPHPQMSKQSRQALSATPRNRLSHGESWIKRKPEATRDYSKHWVMQEAEQRRLEQQSRSNKRDQKATSAGSSGFSPMTKSLSNSSLGSSSFAPQNLNSTDPQYRSTDFALNRALDPSSRSGDMSSRYSDSRIESRPIDTQVATTRTVQPPINRNTDPNSWRDQATTYQPLPPPASGSTRTTVDKPLPEAIINTITQRVNNMNSRPGSANNSSGRPSPYTTSVTGSNSNLHHAVTTSSHSYSTPDENYHDYMNTDALAMQSNNQNYHEDNSSQSQQQLYANYPARSPYSRGGGSDYDSVSTNGNVPHSHQLHHNQQLPPPSSHHQQNLYESSNSSSHHQNSSHTHDSPQSSPSNQSNASNNNGSPNTTTSSAEDQRLLSVSGKKKCSHCGEELGRGAAMIIESLRLFYHIPCFICCVCGVQLGNGKAGADVRVRNHALHCHNCYSNDQGMKFSKV